MSQRRGIISSPHTHTLKHKLPSTRVWHVCNGVNLEALTHKGLTPLQARNLRWGMNVQIDNVMDKVERNLLSWHQVVLTAKEFNLLLDEHQFERDGGEITWNTSNDLEVAAELGDEEVEVEDRNQEEKNIKSEVKGKSPMKVSVGIENADKVEPNTDAKEGRITDAQIQTLGNFSIEEFKKYFMLDDWTDGAVKCFQTWLKASKEERCEATKKVMLTANNLDPERTAAIIKSLAESPGDIFRADLFQHSADTRAIFSTPDNSQTSSVQSRPAHGLQDSLLNSTTALEHSEIIELSSESTAREQLIPQEDVASRAQLGCQPDANSSQGARRGQVVVTAGDVVTIEYPLDPEDENTAPANAGPRVFAIAKEDIASNNMSIPLAHGNAAEKLATARVEAIVRGVITYQGASGLAAKEASTGQSSGPRLVPYLQVPQMDFAAQVTQESGIAEAHSGCTCACGNPAVSVGDAPVPQWVLRGVDGSPPPGASSKKSDPTADLLPSLDPFEGVYPPEKDRGTEPFRYTPRTATTDEEELAEIEEDHQIYKRAMEARKGELMASAEAQLRKGLPASARNQWKAEEARLDIEIKIRTDQYKAMLIAGRKWEKGETGPPGLGEEAQNALPFLSCDLEEQIRRAGHSYEIREAYYDKLHAAGPDVPPLDFTDEEVSAFTGMWGSEYDAADPEYDAYEMQMSSEYQAALASGMGYAGAAKKAAKVAGKKQLDANDGVEDQIRRRQGAREKQERDRAKMIRERQLAKEAAENDAVGKKSKPKAQKKGKGGGRKHKK